MTHFTSIIEADINIDRLEPFLMKAARFDVMCLAEFNNPFRVDGGLSNEIFRTHAEIISMMTQVKELRDLRCLDQAALAQLSSADMGRDEAVTLAWRDCLLALRDCMAITPAGVLLPLGLKFELHRAHLLSTYLNTGTVE